jgi:hypothetical protein
VQPEGAFHMHRVTFDSNIAACFTSGQALFTSGYGTIANCSFLGHNASVTTIVANGYIQWACPLGTWMNRTATFWGSFNTSIRCLDDCSAGFISTNPFSSTPKCGKICPAGYYCPKATFTPIACPTGKYQPEPGARSPNNCIPVVLSRSKPCILLSLLAAAHKHSGLLARSALLVHTMTARPPPVASHVLQANCQRRRERKSATFVRAAASALWRTPQACA